MQWNVQEMEKWEELRPFVDTALLPLYLYRPELEVQEHVLRMTYLMNLAASIEQKLKGRVLLFPVCYKFASEPGVQGLPDGFVHRICLHFQGDQISEKQQNVHHLTVGDEELDSALRFDVTVDILAKEIIRIWQAK
ncbi:YpiF family protein [Brevibacillus ruminantium]|uniref:YpiF family protein n=1 Tax=Brevibacillus ruminantium TaxID=2950604 RepID=A0ABY4WFQ0_9BACL|nr:DUF2487 family protein [Brevibacillus ruminantium]USG63491.1 YpiF family protein [Brevibacillus ruminantium]